MRCIRRHKYTEVSKSMSIKEIACDLANRFRRAHDLGMYCGKTIVNIVDKLSIGEAKQIKLIRRPFNSERLAGFIAYKHDTFIIVTNTNKTVGNERFTVAHEIYHLLENLQDIMDKRLLEELVHTEGESINNGMEKMANYFAAELLMPSEDVKYEFERLSSRRKDKSDISIVINLQQLYGVDYIAMVKRLAELELITAEKDIKSLEEAAENMEELMNITLRLGFDNEVNTESKVHYISNQYLDMLRTNYENKLTDYNDLAVIFDYLGCEPERFGYTRYNEQSEEARDFISDL